MIAHNKENDISSGRPIRLLFLSVVLLSVAFNAGLFSSLLNVVGVEDRVARIAGSRLSVMSALIGAGLLMIAISSWARHSRMLAVSTAHANALKQFAQEHVGRVEVLPGLGAGFSGEVAGLRVEVVVEPTNGGQAWVRAMCPASRTIQIWPRGLAPEDIESGGFRVSLGPSWEAWSDVEGSLHSETMQPIEDAFFKAGVSEILHNRSGIEIALSNAPGDSLIQRITYGLAVATSLSRANR